MLTGAASRPQLLYYHVSVDSEDRDDFDEFDEPGNANDDPFGIDDGSFMIDFDEFFSNGFSEEDFIAGATFREPSAEEREARRLRQENLQRLLADESAQRDASEYGRHRYAPSEYDDDYTEYSSAPRSIRQRPWVKRVALLIVLAMVITVGSTLFVEGGVISFARTLLYGQNETRAPTLIDTVPTVPSSEVPEDLGPTPPEDPPTVRLGPVVTPPDNPGQFNFLALQQDGTGPVAYDPCRSIRYVTSGTGPPGSEELIRLGFERITQATGLVFVDDGVTNEIPSANRPAFQPDAYGDRWAPVLVAWSDPVTSPLLAASEEDGTNPAGYAGSVSFHRTMTRDGEIVSSTPQVYVTGTVVLDTEDLADMLAERDGQDSVLGIIVHELAHLVGLGHVDDRDELMYPIVTLGNAEFGSGDRAGLAALGNGACVPEL